jgi:hypothetical protein
MLEDGVERCRLGFLLPGAEVAANCLGGDFEASAVRFYVPSGRQILEEVTGPLGIPFDFT